MTMFISVKRALRTAVVALSLFAAGCGSSSSPSQLVDNFNSINPAALLVSINTGITQPAKRALDGWDWGNFLSTFSTLLSKMSYSVDMQKVSYQSIGADGQTHTMTGLLILPNSITGGKPSVPILMYQHGTEVNRAFSPSQYLAHRDRPKDYPEVMVAAAIASTGYAVAMVDYEGMGDNTSSQPHVIRDAMARQVVDLLKASHNIIVGSGSPCTWNSQLFLMGYSEGGYATMAATRELQLNPVPGFTVTASAPLSGPHDLSGVMRGLLLSESAFKAPYFAPLFLTSYNYAYGGQTNLFSPDFAMQAQFNTTLPPLFKGLTSSDVISEAMGMNFTTPTLVVMKSILTPQFITQLSDVTTPSPVVARLQQNDSYRGWAPTVPMRMIHHKSDELVPYANSKAAFDAFSSAGAKNHVDLGPGVELVEETAVISISTDPVKTVHFGSAFPELSRGWEWLNRFKK